MIAFHDKLPIAAAPQIFQEVESNLVWKQLILEPDMRKN